MNPKIGARVVVLAVDGLEWPLLQRLAADGRLPSVSHLVEQGLSAPLAHPAPHHSATHWASVATGCHPHQHGICHPLLVRPDGLVIEPATAAALRRPPFWQRVWEAGGVAKVAGWPATLDASLPVAAPGGSVLVADGFAFAEVAVESGWPLAPGAVVPVERRAGVRAGRVHPDRVTEPELDGFGPSLQSAAKRLSASWASVHHLGRQWAAEDDWQLLALRFDGLTDWLSAAVSVGMARDQALAPWCVRLDAMLGHYLDAVGPDSHLLVLTETIAPLLPETRVDTETVTGLDGGESANLRMAGLGGFFAVGPGVASQRPTLPMNALHVGDRVLEWLAIEPVPADPAVEAPQASKLSAPALDDPAAADWLRDHGIAPAEGDKWAARADRVRIESLVGLALSCSQAGGDADAAEALQQALAIAPADDPSRIGLSVLLARSGFEADGRCSPMPTASWHDPVAIDFVAALAAFGEREWAAAETRLARLIEFAPRAIAALAAAWMGRARLAQDDREGADRFLGAALAEEAANPSAWMAWAEARAASGRPEEAVDGLTSAIAVLPGHGALIAMRARLAVVARRPPPDAIRPIGPVQ